MLSGVHGLGRSYLGEAGGVQAAINWNSKSARGSKDPANWSVKSGFSGPSDKKLAEAVYQYQHDVQCRTEGHAKLGPGSRIDPYKKRPDCNNRDGMIGNKTMCLIVREIKAGTAWGQFWGARLNVGQNTSQYGGAALCQLDCAEVHCDWRLKTGCPACQTRKRRRRPPVTSTPKPTLPAPIRRPAVIDTVETAGIGGGTLALLAVGGAVALYYYNKRKKR